MTEGKEWQERQNNRHGDRTESSSAGFYESHLLVFLDVFKTSFLVAESLSGVVSEKDRVDTL